MVTETNLEINRISLKGDIGRIAMKVVGKKTKIELPFRKVCAS